MNEAKRIAIVDDEEALTATLAFAFRREGFEIELFHDGATAWQHFSRRLPHLIVLDIMMPKMDGLALCKLLRGEGMQVPIIFLSSRDDEIDRLLGFESGGDDYLSKPFSVRELLARVRAVLRRSSGVQEGGVPSVVDMGDLRIDTSSARCFFGDHSVPLTLTELRILLSLLELPGGIKSREQLMAAAFPEDLYANERAVDSHIKRIRKKMTALGLPYDPLETVYGMGYRFTSTGSRR